MFPSGSIRKSDVTTVRPLWPHALVSIGSFKETDDYNFQKDDGDSVVRLYFWTQRTKH